MKRWVLRRQPQLESALRAWGRDPEDARRLVERLLVEAFLASKSGLIIRREVPWMAGTLGNLWSEISRRRRRERADSRVEDIPGNSEPHEDVLARSEDLLHLRAWLVGLAFCLPRPYGHILYWRAISGWSGARITRELCQCRPISSAQGRWLLHETNRMVRLVGMGEDPRARWRQRYTNGKNPWIAAPLPPLESQIHQRRTAEARR